MRKIFLILIGTLLLEALSHSVKAQQSFGNVGLWDLYAIPAQGLIVGSGSKTIKPDTSAAVEIRGRKKTLYLRGVAHRDSVYSPKPGMIVVDSSDFHIYFRGAASWVRLDSVSASGGSTYDTTYLYAQLALKVKYTDTAAMLSPYLRKLDTANLSARINLKFNTADTVNKWLPVGYTFPGTDTTHLSARINLKLNSADTASLSNRINLKLNSADTANLSARINLKANQQALEDTAAAIRADFPTGGGTQPLDSVLAAGETGYNKNIAIDRTSGSHGLYLSKSGFDYGHFEVNAAGTQLHQYDGDRESIVTEDSINVIDNATGKSISLQPTYIKADTFKVFSGLAVSNITSSASSNQQFVLPAADGTAALIAQTVTNGNTVTSPSEDAVFDAIATAVVNPNLITVSATTPLTLTLTSTYWVYDNGLTAGTWTLPPATGNDNVRLVIRNACIGTTNLTINADSGSSEIKTTAVLVSTFNIATGQSKTLVAKGGIWYGFN